MYAARAFFCYPILSILTHYCSFSIFGEPPELHFYNIINTKLKKIYYKKSACWAARADFVTRFCHFISNSPVEQYPPLFFSVVP
jgi:hypothetical protein